MKTLWNQIKFQKELYLIGGLVMLGLYLFGMILHDFLLMGDDEVTGVLCMGSFMAMIAVISMMLFFVGIHMVQIFNYAVAMGQTRKRIFPAYTIATFLTFLVLEIFLKVLNILEVWRLGLMFPGLDIENFVEPALHIPYLLAFALVGTAFSVLLGAAISRFGKAAFWVWWVMIMAVCIGGPRAGAYLVTYCADSRLTALMMEMLDFVAAHGEAIGVVAVIAATMIFTGAAYLIVRRQQVNV